MPKSDIIWLCAELVSLDTRLQQNILFDISYYLLEELSGDRRKECPVYSWPRGSSHKLWTQS